MAARWRRRHRSGEPEARGGGESGLGRRRVQGILDLGVKKRRISLARVLHGGTRRAGRSTGEGSGDESLAAVDRSVRWSRLRWCSGRRQRRRSMAEGGQHW
jgi:hypothetical protein